MNVDGKEISEGQRMRLLTYLEDESKTQTQQELPLAKADEPEHDDVRYQWRDNRGQEDEAHRAMAGIIVAVCCSVPLLVLLFWFLFS